jgi:hypothetical protein
MKDFVFHEEALSLKELGFDEPCFMIYYNGTDEMRGEGHFLFGRDIKAPTFSQAFRFFREKYELYAWVKVEYEYGGITPTYYITGKRQGDIPGGPFNTYEDAELQCLRKLIKIAKQNELIQI